MGMNGVDLLGEGVSTELGILSEGDFEEGVWKTLLLPGFFVLDKNACTLVAVVDIFKGLIKALWCAFLE